MTGEKDLSSVSRVGRVESQTRFFENIIFEHYRIDERTRQFFIFAQSNLGDEGVK